MAKVRTSPCLPATSPAREQSWNVIEFTTQKHIRQDITNLLHLCSAQNVTTDEIRRELLRCEVTFGSQFTIQLVRALHRDDEAERQAITWLLTVLDATETIPPLQQMAANRYLPRTTRLAASLALAGMGVTARTLQENRRVLLYAIS